MDLRHITRTKSLDIGPCGKTLGAIGRKFLFMKPLETVYFVNFASAGMALDVEPQQAADWKDTHAQKRSARIVSDPGARVTKLNLVMPPFFVRTRRSPYCMGVAEAEPPRTMAFSPKDSVKELLAEIRDSVISESPERTELLTPVLIAQHIVNWATLLGMGRKTLACQRGIAALRR